MSDLDRSYVDWKDWDRETFGQCTATDAAYFASETGIRPHTDARVLEIGFGNGNFLGWAQSVGASAFGIETNPLLTERAKVFLGTEHVLDSLEAAGNAGLRGTFTHIVAFDVIEHVPLEALILMLRQSRDLLAANGRIIVRFPNGDSPFGRITQHGDPTHVTTLGHQKLEFTARSAGLRVSTVRSPKLPVSGVGFTRGIKRRVLTLGRALVERVVSQLYFGGRRIPLDPNCVAVLERAEPVQTETT
jgi:SAM-dependent methyltransferase